MAQVYGHRRAEKTDRPLFNTQLFRLLLCVFIFTVAAVCKNVLPDGYRNALVVGLDSGLTFRDVLEVFGESASSQEVFSRLWTDGVLKVFGFAEDEREVSGDLDEKTSAAPQTPEDTSSVSVSLDISDELTIPVTTHSELDIDADELPIFSTVAESPNIAAQTPEEGGTPDVSEEPSGGDTPQDTDAEAVVAEPYQLSTGDSDLTIPDVVIQEAVSIPFDYVTPALGTLTSGFGYRDHPIDGEYKFHYGVDIAVAMRTEVGAFSDGKVVFAGWGDINGNYIKVEHADGFATLYAHLDELLVETGDTVEKGETIGMSGQTGEVSGPHLHFQIYYHDKLVDPEAFLEFV